MRGEHDHGKGVGPILVDPSPDEVIESERLVLEPLRVEHAELLFQEWQAAELYRYIPQDPPRSVSDLEARYRVLMNRRSPDGSELWLNWVLRCRRDCVPVGLVEVSIGTDATAHLAYFIFPRSWRQGFAKEACSRVITLLFDEYRTPNVRATIDTRNIASIRLVESLGFRRVKLTGNADHFKGEPSDDFCY